MADKNIQIKFDNGVDWDNLFPKTKASITMLNDDTSVESKISEILSSLNNVATITDVQNEIQTLIGSAPEALDTLHELADALNNDPDFASTVVTQLANKVDKVTGKGLSSNDFTDTLKTKLEGLEGISVGEDEPSSGIWFEEI